MLKYIWRSYLYFSALLVFIVICYAVFLRYYYYIVQTDIPVFLGNGFVLVEHPDMEKDNRMIANKKGNVLVQSNVRALAVEGKTVYGSRSLFFGLDTKYVYFICVLGEDCSDTQNYNKLNFKAEVGKRGLPPFVGPHIQSVSNLILKENLARLFTLKDAPEFYVNAVTVKEN